MQDAMQHAMQDAMQHVMQDATGRESRTVRLQTEDCICLRGSDDFNMVHVVREVKDIKDIKYNPLSVGAQYRKKGGGRVPEKTRRVEAGFLIAVLTANRDIDAQIPADIKYQVDAVFTSKEHTKCGLRVARFNALFSSDNVECRTGWDIGKAFYNCGGVSISCACLTQHSNILCFQHITIDLLLLCRGFKSMSNKVLCSRVLNQKHQVCVVFQVVWAKHLELL
jgi:hypothetical protein